MTNRIIISLILFALIAVFFIVLSDRKKNKTIFKEKSSDYTNQELQK